MNFSDQLPILIIVVPLLAALVCSILGLFARQYCNLVTVLAMAAVFADSLGILFRVITEGTIHYRLGGWPPPFGIEYVIDHLNALVLFVIALVALCSAVFCRRSVERELPEKIATFHTLYLLMITGLLGITVTGDAFNLYVLVEISALTSYALIAGGKGRAALSAFNYLILGTIGACFYLLGVGHLYIMTGSLNMPDLHNLLPGLYESNPIQVAFVFILIGVWVKMAFFPLHGWLPNAYTHAPSATSCVMAPLMTKVSVYVMIRIMFSVFSPEFTFDRFPLHGIITGLAVVGIVAGSLLALAQRDFKKMLTYLIVAEVGYMVGGVWLGNSNGITGAVLHILNDALMTLCLFMVVGIVVYKTKGHKLKNMKGLFRKMPFTMAAFVVGALSMIGVPPTCGFFSKWYLIQGAIDAGAWPYLGALIFSSLVNAVLFFRVIEIAYFPEKSEGHGHHGHEEDSTDEAPLSMLLPLLFVAALLIVIGCLTGEIVNGVIWFAVPGGII
ncbi:MAG: complex I subunit 5 family protein [Planctomycetota bacterium]|jgi:multicomponent Na+:H+ antiporter subunit D